MSWLLEVAPIVASSDTPGWLLLAGPFAGGGTWWALYRYYRNTDKSHSFERETAIVAQPVAGNDTKINEVRRTQRKRVSGDNRDSHRARVKRIG
jgi:hypothetical protein